MSIRMRAQDGTLGRTVFWNSNVVDSGGENYSGPGPLTDIVVFKVDLAGAFLSTSTAQTASFAAAPGFLYLLDNPGKSGEAQLPSAASAGRQAIVAFKLTFDTGGWAVIPNGSDTVDGQTSWQLYPVNCSMFMISDGVSNWDVISNTRDIRLQQDGTDLETPSAFSTINFISPLIASNDFRGQAEVTVGPIAQITEFTYLPGAGRDTVGVFDTWYSLYTALSRQRDVLATGTQFTIFVDNSLTTPATLQVGTFDMTGVTLSGVIKPTGNVSVVVPEGVSLPNLKRITGHLDITFTGSTPPIQYVNTAPGLFLELDHNATITCSGSGPFIRLDTSSFMSALMRFDGGAINTGTYEVIQMGPSAGTVSLQAYVDANPYDVANTNSIIGTNTIRGNAASTVTLTTVPGTSVSESQSNLINPFQVITTKRRVGRLFSNATGAAVTANEGYLNVYHSTAPTNVNLVAATNLRGITTTIKSDKTSSSTLSVVPHAGDTIDGASSFPLASANKSVTIVSDGVSNWEVIAST